MVRKAPRVAIRPRRKSSRGASIDTSDVEARLPSPSRKTIAEIVDKHPDEALAVLRSWLRQGGWRT
jgi:flagellar biosynthesis/type III secretory pathway M-ring protein FliF/YscJ